MVDRFLLFKLVDSGTRSEFAALLNRGLAQLPGLTQIVIGLPADEASRKSWDVSCVLRFATQQALDEALASQDFQSCMQGDLKARCAVVKAWSFEQI